MILPPQTVDQILALTPARWDPIQQEALNVLEQVMRRSIRDQEMDTVIRSIPSLVSLSLDEDPGQHHLRAGDRLCHAQQLL